jgi:mannose-6-phosphate isomerase
MINQIIKLRPFFQDKIWGGDRLSTAFGYELPSSKIGECWAISAHPHGDCQIISTPFQGLTLSQLYSLHRKTIFNETREKFPLLVKIIDAHDDLSVQVHPSDEYAKEKHDEFGKSEAWVILDCDKDSKIQIGHLADNYDQLAEMVHKGNWEKLLKYHKLTPGEVFNITPGTIHALCKGTLLYEVQQSSDLTYRLYDYNRHDELGNGRLLHIDAALDVINVPDKPLEKSSIVINEQFSLNKKIISNEFFSLFFQVVDGYLTIDNSKRNYFLVSVIDGSGKINDEFIKKGDHFIIPISFKNFVYHGNLKMLVTMPS